MRGGVGGNEIAFIHDANTETRKAELFAKVRSGQIRFLLGSTAKMGAGTNIRDRLIALHHLDVSWCPSEEGRAGRCINKLSKIKAFCSSVTASIICCLAKSTRELRVCIWLAAIPLTYISMSAMYFSKAGFLIISHSRRWLKRPKMNLDI